VPHPGRAVVVLGHARLALLVHHQHELDPHGCSPQATHPPHSNTRPCTSTCLLDKRVSDDDTVVSRTLARVNRVSGGERAEHVCVHFHSLPGTRHGKKSAAVVRSWLEGVHQLVGDTYLHFPIRHNHAALLHVVINTTHCALTRS
jgi:hypothetical protein